MTWLTRCLNLSFNLFNWVQWEFLNMQTVFKYENPFLRNSLQVSLVTEFSTDTVFPLELITTLLSRRLPQWLDLIMAVSLLSICRRRENNNIIKTDEWKSCSLFQINSQPFLGPSCNTGLNCLSLMLEQLAFHAKRTFIMLWWQSQ